jgi:chaperonin GroES
MEEINQIDQDQEIAESDTKLTIEDILKADNLCEILDPNTQKEISQQVFSDYNNDLSSCASRMKELQEVMKLAMIISEQKTYPWVGASNIIYPLIANACVEFGATCYPEIIKDGQVVKAKVIGKDDGQQMKDADGIPMTNPEDGKPIMQNVGVKKARGERVSTVMNYQLMEEQTWWEKDTDKLVNSLPCVGDLYKKVYYDPIKEIPVSELIFPDKLIINNGARDIDSAIVTQIIELYPQEIMQRIRSEMFDDFDFDFESDAEESNNTTQQTSQDMRLTTQVSSNTKLHVFLEQHTWLDLDDDGFPEPYIVTVHSESAKVVRIVKRFAKEDIKYNSKNEIKDIVAQKYFVHYSFIPSPDGSFFSLGFGHLLLNMNNAINTTLNQLIDAGHLNITGGGFISKGFGKTKAGRMALAPGEWKIVDAGSDDLRAGIVPIPHPEPSSVLFTLLGALMDAGKSLGMLSDVLSGENAGNIQATTMISMVEQGMKQFRSIYKRIYKSEKDEFRLLYNENAKYLTNEKYAEILDEPLIDVDVKGDFDKKGYDICPVADIDAVTNFQRMAMAQFFMTFLQDPYTDPIELRKRIFSAANVEDIDKLVVAPQPQVDPALQIAQLQAQTKMAELEAKNNIESQKAFADIEQLKATIGKMEAETAEIQTRSMVNLATAGKIAKDTDLAESKEQLDVLDNQIDAMAKQAEIQDKKEDREFKAKMEAMKLYHNAITEKEYIDLEHKKLDVKKEQEAKTTQQSQKKESD